MFFWFSVSAIMSWRSPRAAVVPPIRDFLHTVTVREIGLLKRLTIVCSVYFACTVYTVYTKFFLHAPVSVMCHRKSIS